MSKKFHMSKDGQLRECRARTRPCALQHVQGQNITEAWANFENIDNFSTVKDPVSKKNNMEPQRHRNFGILSNEYTRGKQFVVGSSGGVVKGDLNIIKALREVSPPGHWPRIQDTTDSEWSPVAFYKEDEKFSEEIEEEIRSNPGVYVEVRTYIPNRDGLEYDGVVMLKLNNNYVPRRIRKLNNDETLDKNLGTTLEKYSGQSTNYSSYPTKNVSILPDVRHCGGCNEEIYSELTSRPDLSFGFERSWAHDYNSDQNHRANPKLQCSYCHTDDPSDVKSTFEQYSDNVTCSRCGGIVGRPIGD